MPAKHDDKDKDDDLDPIELAPTDAGAGESPKKPGEGGASEPESAGPERQRARSSEAGDDQAQISPEQVIELESEAGGGESSRTPDGSQPADEATAAKGRRTDAGSSDNAPDASGDDEQEAGIYDLAEPPPADDADTTRNVLLDEIDADADGADAAGSSDVGTEGSDRIPEQPKFRSDAEKARKRAEQRARRSEQMKAEYQRKRKIRLIVGGAVLLVFAVVCLLFIL